MGIVTDPLRRRNKAHVPMPRIVTACPQAHPQATRLRARAPASANRPSKRTHKPPGYEAWNRAAVGTAYPRAAIDRMHDCEGWSLHKACITLADILPKPCRPLDPRPGSARDACFRKKTRAARKGRQASRKNMNRKDAGCAGCRLSKHTGCTECKPSSVRIAQVRTIAQDRLPGNPCRALSSLVLRRG